MKRQSTTILSFFSKKKTDSNEKGTVTVDSSGSGENLTAREKEPILELNTREDDITFQNCCASTSGQKQKNCNSTIQTTSESKQTHASNLDSTDTEKPSIHVDDPSRCLPNDRLDRSARIRRGPYQPRLASYPSTLLGSGKNVRDTSFNSKWFDIFNWLEYSIEKDAAFCFPCRCFIMNDCSLTGATEDTFVKSGFSYWRKAVAKFKKHEASKCHTSSIVGWKCFDESKSIDMQIDEAKESEMKEKEKLRIKNREYMTRLVDVVRTLAKGGKPLRGHNENQDSPERGLFLETVGLLLRYDPFFKTYHENVAKNSTYLSNRIQNDILQATKNVVLRQITNEVSNQSVSVIADETSDIAHHEQMAVVIRYIPIGEDLPVERFVALKKLNKTDAETIFNAIGETLLDIGVKWGNVISVCFDGASAMAGQFNGVQAKCKEQNPSILYVHCYAHCLNLALVSACTSHKSNPLISEFFGVVQLMYNFIEGSPKRHTVFEDLVKQSNAKLKTLKSLSDTRWACRSEAVSAVAAQFENIIQAINEIIAETSDVKARATGKGILYQIKTVNFIACLKIMNPILNIIVKCSKTLQTSDINLCEAVEEVESVASALAEMRNDKMMFDDIYKETEKMCTKLDVDVPLPRKRRVSVLLNHAAASPENDFHVTTKKNELRLFTYYPVLDTLIQGLNDRFSQETKSVISSIGRIVGLNLGSEKWTGDDLVILKNQFGIDPDALCAELKILKSRKEECVPPTNVREWIFWLSKSQRGARYNNFHAVLKMFATIPVTSCSCERGFSKLSIIKTKLRSTMGQDRLENLILPFIEQQLSLAASIDSIVDEFKMMVPNKRRMCL